MVTKHSHWLPTHSNSQHELDKDKCVRLRTKLLAWYSENARELPWRLPALQFGSAPYEEYILRFYKCLLSETMLQQTQVKTVLTYYTKWLERFPTLVDLAEASEDDVMSCWAGLGYYSRAKRLKQAAQYMQTNFVQKRAELPIDPQFYVKNVPGVGPYTAGAIISISFGCASAIVDGNVQRVLSRVLAVHGDTSTPNSPGVKLLWKTAQALVSGKKPGDFNQSLMDLGATICSPKNPICEKCPIETECLARKIASNWRPSPEKTQDFFGKKDRKERRAPIACPADVEDLCVICPSDLDPSVMPTSQQDFIQSIYPFKPRRKELREEASIVLVLLRDGQVYLEKKEKGLLAGLYDFPTTLIIGSDDIDSIVAARAKELQAKVCGTTLHLFSHIRRTSYVLTGTTKLSHDHAAKLLLDNATGKWVDQATFSALGVSELCLKNSRLAFGDTKGRMTMKRKATAPVRSENMKRKQPIIELDRLSNVTAVESLDVLGKDEINNGSQELMHISTLRETSQETSLKPNHAIDPEVPLKVDLCPLNAIPGEKRASRLFSLFTRKCIAK